MDFLCGDVHFTFMYRIAANLLPSGPRILGRSAAVRKPGSRKPNRAGWIPILFFLEAVAAILTVALVRYVLSDSGNDRATAVFAVGIWNVLLVGAASRTVVAWCRLRAAII
jgi:hypothetical protein